MTGFLSLAFRGAEAPCASYSLWPEPTCPLALPFPNRDAVLIQLGPFEIRCYALA